MKVADLTSVLNNDRSVHIIRFADCVPAADYDSINNVELRFANEDVAMIDFDTDMGDYEIYIY